MKTMYDFVKFIKDNYFWCKEAAIFNCVCIALFLVCMYTLHWIITVGIYLTPSIHR